MNTIATACTIALISVALFVGWIFVAAVLAAYDEMSGNQETTPRRNRYVPRKRLPELQRVRRRTTWGRWVP